MQVRSVLCIVCVSGAVCVGVGADEPSRATEDSALPTPNSTLSKQLYTGRVVRLPDALKKRGITSYDEMKDQVVLETFDGRLFPIVSDWRGRAFYQDERLRDRKVELVCNERPGIPYLQVLAVFTFDEKGDRRATDYWCDICAIPMYEIKPCDCCQGESRLRFRAQSLPDYLKGRARVPVGARKQPAAVGGNAGDDETGE